MLADIRRFSSARVLLIFAFFPCFNMRKISLIPRYKNTLTLIHQALIIE